jgi:hypothetical protein
LLNEYVLKSSSHGVKYRIMSSVEMLNICAVVKFCKHMGDTHSATYENVRLMKGNESTGRSFSDGRSHSKMAKTRSQIGKGKQKA